MPSERVRAILLSRGVAALSVDAMSEAQGWQLVYEFDALEKKECAERVRLPEVCLTGFTPAGKTALKALAEAHGYVRDSVTKGCQLLVIGPNAGPKKLEKARCQGCNILKEEEFRSMVASGAQPPACP